MIIQIIVAMGSVLAFGVLFHIPKSEYLYCALNGDWLGCVSDLQGLQFWSYCFFSMGGPGPDSGGKGVLCRAQNAQYSIFDCGNI